MRIYFCKLHGGNINPTTRLKFLLNMCSCTDRFHLASDPSGLDSILSGHSQTFPSFPGFQGQVRHVSLLTYASDFFLIHPYTRNVVFWSLQLLAPVRCVLLDGFLASFPDLSMLPSYQSRSCRCPEFDR